MTDIDDKLLDEVLDNESNLTTQTQKTTMNLSTLKIFAPSQSKNGSKSRVKYRKKQYPKNILKF